MNKQIINNGQSNLILSPLALPCSRILLNVGWGLLFTLRYPPVGALGGLLAYLDTSLSVK